MRFCANVSILFKEVPFLERFGRTREAGFSAVEFWWPGGEDLDEVERALKAADLSVALFNFYAGDMPAGERGLVSENVEIQHDFYHMQRMEGNLVANLREYAGSIGHVQVADSPGRGEPGTGEIHYPYVFGALEEVGYEGYVGLEYNPTTDRTEDSFAWIPAGMRGGDVGAEDLKL